MTTLKNVYEAWSAVMQSVRAIAKDDKNMQQGFNFRGIDATMQAVGPALREHGVFVVPSGQELRSESYSTRSGTQMKNVTVTVQYTVFGPGGDTFSGVAYGEAADVGDKAVTKAQSVALRTFLLQSLMVPTGDPDPDAVSHERAAPPTQTPADAARANLAKLLKAKKVSMPEAAKRFADDYGVDIREAGKETIEAFHTVIASE